MSEQNQLPSVSHLEAVSFEDFIQMALAGLQSDASRKQYSYTYAAWSDWCEQHEIATIHMNIHNVTQYLKQLTRRDGQSVTFQTRRLHLTHLRKLLEGLALYHPFFKARHDELNYMKAPIEGSNDDDHVAQALTPEDVMLIANAWADDRSLIGLRNHALINLTFATGARISEIAKAEWSHLNVVSGTLLIPRGKGRKRRTATVIDDLPINDAMRDWRFVVPRERRFLFPRVYRGGNLGPDKPMSRQAIDKIVRDTADHCGVAFHHHQARLTLGTELLQNGGENIIRDVMDQFGHNDARTLLKHYVAPNRAVLRKQRFNTRWQQASKTISNDTTDNLELAEAYQFKILLTGIQPAIWRRFAVPKEISFALLHQIIQIMMGWENSHLYQFELGEHAFLETPMHTGDQDAELKIDPFLAEQAPLTYIYDFGDRWHHQVILEASLTQTIAIPQCLDGQNACPPEDSGGNRLFHQLLQAGKKNPDKTDPQWQQWIGDNWQPQAFDLDAVNEELRIFWLWYHADVVPSAGDDHDEY